MAEQELRQETVETVADNCLCSVTGLKPGVNETGLGVKL